MAATRSAPSKCCNPCANGELLHNIVIVVVEPFTVVGCQGRGVREGSRVNLASRVTRSRHGPANTSFSYSGGPRQSRHPPLIVQRGTDHRTRDAGTAMASRTSSRSLSRSVSSGSTPPRRATPAVELSPAEKEKEAQITAACEGRDISALVELATSVSGLVSDRLRCTACWSLNL